MGIGNLALESGKNRHVFAFRHCSYTDRFLRIRDVGDWDNALNGLQIQNSGRVTRIGAAVDVSTRVLTEAQQRDVDLLIVHHGLFFQEWLRRFQSERGDELCVVADFRMDIEREMRAIKRDVIFNAIRSCRRNAPHRLQSRPEQTVMDDQQIDIIF